MEKEDYKWLIDAIDTQETLMQEYEDRPESEEYKSARDAWLKLKAELRADQELAMKEEESKKKLKLQEEETASRIEDNRNRNKTEMKKAGVQLLGSMILGGGFMWFERSGFVFPTKALSAIKSLTDKIHF
jgi:hypothetical protein